MARAAGGTGWLPAVHQVTELRSATPLILHLSRGATAPFLDTRRLLDFAQSLNRQHAAERPGDDRLSARIAAELAFRMQLATPETEINYLVQGFEAEADRRRASASDSRAARLMG